MIELLFSDSATAALKCAKQDGNGVCVGGVAAKLAMDDNGDSSWEEYEPEPYTGPTVDGSPEDVVGIWLVGSIGDISNINNWKKRIDTIDLFLDIYEDDSLETDWSEKAAKQAIMLVERIRNAAQDGEKIRIWWSDSAEETSGFYWAMTLLQHENANVTQIKVPDHMCIHEKMQSLSGTGSLEPALFSELLSLEQPVSLAERSCYAKRWNKLVLENAPLRAVINGTLCSVPESFYDFILRQALPDEPVRVAQVIGNALINGPIGINDWWYANRLHKMIADGEVTVKEHRKPFYNSLIEKIP